MAALGTCLKLTALLALAVASLIPLLTKYDVIKWSVQDATVKQEPIKKVVKERILSKSELARYDGSQPDQPVYLAFLGKVYDVSSGKKHYGKGGGYSFFSGKDATRAYISGDFTPKGLIDDIEDLPVERYTDINQWTELYEKQYVYVGKLHGAFYTEDGTPTDQLSSALQKVEQAKALKNDEAKLKRDFPDCNVEWTPSTGSRVWCSRESGGISRNWVGVPRKFYTPGQKTFRCACVSTERRSDGRLHSYPGCHDEAVECKVEVQEKQNGDVW